MTRDTTEQRGPSRAFRRLRAIVMIAGMALAGGLLAQAGREVQAQDAYETYVRTASPASPEAAGA